MDLRRHPPVSFASLHNIYQYIYCYIYPHKNQYRNVLPRNNHLYDMPVNKRTNTCRIDIKYVGVIRLRAKLNLVQVLVLHALQ